MKRLFPIIVLFIAQSLFSAPYAGSEFDIKQPDGSKITIKAWGDEFYIRAETLDGYTLTKDPDTSWICYAQLSSDGNSFKSTSQKYIPNQKPKLPKNLKKHLKLSQKARKQKILKGKKLLQKPKPALSPTDESASSTSEIQAGPTTPLIDAQILGLTLLINFPDEPATIAKSEIEDFVNLVGYSANGNNGSVYDFFYDISDGNLQYTNYVTDYYTAINNKSYYTDPTIDIGIRARELILEALEALDASGFDFSTLSTDSSDYILAINAFYAGGIDNAWSEGLWPHKYYVPGFFADGVYSDEYQITNIGTSLKLRTFCHENGHMVCDYPDLYDYGNDSRGVGNYCLMGYGGSDYNPLPPCGPLRQMKGWQIDKGAFEGCELLSNSNEMYKHTNPSDSQEYFIVEAIQKTGRGTSFPDEGLAIWHVDENGSNDNQQMTESLHYLISLEQADGEFDLENNIGYGDSTDLFDSTDDTFDDNTLPNAHWWDGSNSGLSIFDISDAGEIMTFNDYGIFDFEAFALLSKYWENTGCTSEMPCGEADFYTDSNIDVNDLMMLADNWLNEIIYYVPSIGDDFETGDFSQLPWVFSGNTNWTVVSDEIYEGNYATRSGPVNSNESSSISFNLDTGNSNKISFARKVSSKSGHHFLDFYIDGVLTGQWSGEVNWSVVEYNLPSGTSHTFEWEYTKNNSAASGSNCGWIDDIKIFQAN